MPGIDAPPPGHVRVAVVDIGTNSTRLLIADVGPDGTDPRARPRLRVTRLGEAVDADGPLEPAAIDRVCRRPRRLRQADRRHGPRPARRPHQRRPRRRQRPRVRRPRRRPLPLDARLIPRRRGGPVHLPRRHERARPRRPRAHPRDRHRRRLDRAGPRDRAPTSPFTSPSRPASSARPSATSATTRRPRPARRAPRRLPPPDRPRASPTTSAASPDRRSPSPAPPPPAPRSTRASTPTTPRASTAIRST